MVTKEQYDEALAKLNEAQSVINDYSRQQREAFEQRLKDNPIFTDDELVYSAETLCPCGHGLAYPKDAGVLHYWDCSAILKGVEDKSAKHTGQLPFSMYSIKAEGETPSSPHTTRGVFRPKPEPAQG